MATKISTIVDEKVWEEFKKLAQEGHQNIGGLLSEALSDFLRKKQLRPDVVEIMEKSMSENVKLGKLLAK